MTQRVSINSQEVWEAHASCKDHPDPELWWPEEGEQGTEGRTVCAACPVRHDCLQHALAEGEKWGTWGGTSERGRRFLRRHLANSPHGPFRKIGCDCSLCRALDWHEHRMAALLADEAAERLYDNGPGAQHGKASTYARGCTAGPDGTACEPCRDAMRASRRRNRNRPDEEAS